MKKGDFAYEIERHEKFLFSQLSEREKRLYAGLAAMQSGYYGVSEVSKRLNIHRHTVRRGKTELLREIVPEAKKVRRKGGGRKKKRQ